MSAASPRLLFIPVSAPSGMGEYGRALAMANAVAARRADAAIQFAISIRAPYAHSVPYPALRLPSSPTFHSPEIAALIREFRPTTVIFDNAGRTAQLRAARGAGARVIFVSARPRARRRAFRLRWMRLIDEHWIAYPRVLAGDPTGLERLKLRLLSRPRLRYLGPVLPAPDAHQAVALLARLGLARDGYVAVVPGGATGHAGTAAALEALAAAATRIAASGLPTVLVGLDRGAAADPKGLHRVARLAPEDLAELLRGASLVIANGGYTLLQALACDRPCIAIPLVADQWRRIERCVAAGIALRGPAESQALAELALHLLSDTAELEALKEGRARAGIGNAAETVSGVLTGSGG